MSAKEIPTASGKQAKTHSLGQVVSRLAQNIARLDPGSAAALRRGSLSGAGAAAFWQLMATHQPRTNDETGWATLIQGIAILTPKGTDPNKKSAHEYRLPMGSALSKAKFLDLRLARLLNAPKEMRRDLAVRMCRRLSRTEYSRFNLETLARFILFADDETDRRIARDYYRAKAESERQSTESTD
jgi:CRISPR system Cascade subunit CasB